MGVFRSWISRGDRQDLKYEQTLTTAENRIQDKH